MSRPRHAYHLFTHPDGRWRSGTVLGVIGAAVCGVALIGAGAAVPGPPPVPTGATVSTDGLAAVGAAATFQVPASRPVRVAIAAIGVDAPVQPVDVDRDGRLTPPSLRKPKIIGWYRLGPAPGEAGNAVLVGHVDTEAAGPAVFYRLGRLRPGDRVEVRREDRSTAVFQVDGVRLFPKAQFPADLVYGPAHRAQLRLVTCGGPFDGAAGGYLANTVVTATLVAWRR